MKRKARYLNEDEEEIPVIRKTRKEDPYIKQMVTCPNCGDLVGVYKGDCTNCPNCGTTICIE